MDIFTENSHFFFKIFLKMSLMIFIDCVFKTTVHVHISCYKNEQLKLHRSLLGVKGDAWGETAL